MVNFALLEDVLEVVGLYQSAKNGGHNITCDVIWIINSAKYCVKLHLTKELVVN